MIFDPATAEFLRRFLMLTAMGAGASLMALLVYLAIHFVRNNRKEPKVITLREGKTRDYVAWEALDNALQTADLDTDEIVMIELEHPFLLRVVARGKDLEAVARAATAFALACPPESQGEVSVHELIDAIKKLNS